MENILANIGLITVFLIIIAAIKKLYNWHYYKHSNDCNVNSTFIKDEKVLNAAMEYANGASTKTVRELLLECIDFNEEEVDVIASKLENHAGDTDKISIFFKAVNEILGEEVYTQI